MMHPDAATLFALLVAHSEALFDDGIDYDTFDTINRALWDRIESAGLTAAVQSLWRHQN